MLLFVSYLIDAALLSFLLLVIARIDLTRDFSRPLSVIFLSAAAGIISRLVLGGALGALVSLGAYLTAFWFSLNFFFDLEQKKRLGIFGLFVLVRIIWSFLLR